MQSLEAGVASNGSILLGSNIVCDGYAVGRSTGVVSHFHSDHTYNLPFALCYCKQVLSTPASRELLLLTRGESLPSHLDKLKNLPYLETWKSEQERVTLFPAKHVLGAAQTLVETEEGSRLLYSGDFLVPGTCPPEVDVLVTEATYGSPYVVRYDERNAVLSSLADLVKQLLRHDNVAIIGYQGKIQEIMNALFEREVNVPFLVPPAAYDVGEIYKKYGVEIGDCFMLGTSEAKNVEKDEHVLFLTRNSVVPASYTKIHISGRCLAPLRRLNNSSYVVGLSTHADFNGLLWYVEKSKAKYVVIDGMRHYNACCISDIIKKRLGVSCTVFRKGAIN